MDASTRYILADGAPYLANLAALWAADPALAAQIESLHGRDSYRCEPSKSGPPTVAVPNAQGRPVYLHSRYEPVEEARRLVEPIDFSQKVAFYVHGFGLGYHVEALVDRASDEALFCVFEPDLLLLRTAFEQRDLSRLIEGRRVMFFTQPDKGDLFARLTPHAAFLSVGVEIVSHPPSLQIAAPFHRQMQEWVGEYASFARTSLNTLVLNSRKTAENIARNLGWYVGTPGVERLKDRHKGKPAVIVSAGPSLRKNKHLLRELIPSPLYSGERVRVRGSRAEDVESPVSARGEEGRSPVQNSSVSTASCARPLTPSLSPEYRGEGEEARAIVIAVQTTLQPLLEMGVEPHYVTSLDYHDICTRFFEKLPPTLRTELVAEPKATSAIFSMFPGPVTLVGNDFAEGLLAGAALPPKGTLPAGATVAHLAFYLAEHLGCDPIIFVGQDLGFSDGLCYAPGTSYEDVWRPELGRFCTAEMKQWDQIVRERYILRRIPDHQGRPMYTEERLFTYLQQFERDFAKSRATIIDATEGGAAKRGATPMTLAEAIERYCRSKDEGGRMKDEGNQTRLPPPSSSFILPPSSLLLDALRRRRQEAAEVERISRATLPLLAEIRDHLDDQSRVNRAIGRIDALRARMNELGRCYDLVTQLTQKSELARFEADRRISAAKADGPDRQRRQVERDVENVRAVADAAAEFQRLMDETIARLTEGASSRGARAHPAVIREAASAAHLTCSTGAMT